MMFSRPFNKFLSTLLAAFVAGLSLATIAFASTTPANYWLASSTGQVFAYGKAKNYGSEYRKHYAGAVKGIKGTKDGKGYWLVTSKAHYSFGDARKFKYTAGGLKRYTGKTRPRTLKGRIVGYAVANLPVVKTGGGGTTTTTTATTPTTTTPVTDCSGVAVLTNSLNGATPGQPFSQTLSAGGVGGGSWTWSLKSGNLPSGLSLSSNGTISGTVAASEGGNSDQFTVQAVNSLCPSNPATGGFTINVAAGPMSITTSSLPNGTYGSSYNATVSASGGDHQYVWSGYGLPNGLSISSGGQITGTPTATGTYNGVAITVTDPSGATSPVTSYFTVTISDQAMQITSPTSLSDGQATVAYTSVQFTVTGGTPGNTSSDYTWGATGLPSGMSMSSTGQLSGTPASQGNYTVAVTATDGFNASNHVTVDFPLHVGYAPLGFATPTLTANQGQSYTGHVVAQGGEVPYTMYRLSGSLPTGATFSNGTLTVPSTAAAGEYQITLGVTDSQTNAATAQETFTLWVAPSQTAPDLNVTTTETLTNTNWSGYIEGASTAFTSISGTFNVPSIPTTTSESASTWVGIGGWNGDNNLIQAGVSENRVNGQTTDEAWWETIGSIGSSQLIPPQNQFTVSPGDTINVNVWQNGGSWEATLDDVTSGQSFAAQITNYTGNDLTGEWITEGGGGNPAMFYNGSVNYSNLAASQAGSGMTDLSMNSSFGTSMASAISGSGFNTTY